MTDKKPAWFWWLGVVLVVVLAVALWIGLDVIDDFITKLIHKH